jgi:hypothetical protein
MIEQISTSVKFLAFFTASKQGKTGLTVTIDIYDPSGSQIVTGGSATALGGGLYSYTLSTNNSGEGEYAAIFKTTDATVDAQHIPSLWVLGRAGVENLDAATSTRLPSSSYTAPTAAPTVTAIRQEMDSNSTKLANLDSAVSSRLAGSAYTAPANSDIAGIKAKTDNLPASPAATGDIPSANITAIKAKTDLLETTRLAQCSTVSTTGAQLAAALS